VSAETREAQSPSGNTERFEWLDQWYPLAPVCDLDPAAPHGKTVLGLDVVAWYDRGAGEWRVFEDSCPHRLAPLSEGRVDGKGRLQCVYHGWCFDGAGACKFIPQAPTLGPPRAPERQGAREAVPVRGAEQDPLVLPEHRDVLQRKRPPLVPEIDDPSYHTVFGMRDLPFGYGMLVENVVDPAHLFYAHKGLLPAPRDFNDPGRYVVSSLICATHQFLADRGT
jgi:phenylpropionate dioxygenase-like ring-hydroxylating dioxygenase large terminal subunit